MSVKFVSNLKMSQFDPRVNSKKSELSSGGGVKPNSDFVLKFLHFLIMTPLLRSKENVVTDH